MSETLELGEPPRPKVVALPGIKVPTNEPSQALIKTLRQALELAESGRLQCIIATGFLADGGRLTAWGGSHPNVYEMLGAINWTAIEYADRIKAQNPDPDRPIE